MIKIFFVSIKAVKIELKIFLIFQEKKMNFV